MIADVPGALPIIVGVTGHRDVREEDAARLEGLVREFFATLHRDYPHTPFVVLSALAEGADRLVARIALDMKLPLLAPLPMPRHLYELDFGENSKQEFAGLLDQAAGFYEIPIETGCTEADLLHAGDARTKQFDVLGDYLAAWSQIMLALWDGVPLTKPGGTAVVVEKFRNGKHWPEHAVEEPGGKVYHIVTPRRSNPAPARALTAVWLAPRSLVNETIETRIVESTLQRIEQFNVDLHRHPEVAVRVGKYRTELVPPEIAAQLDHFAVQSVIIGYESADAVAKEFQSKSRQLLKWLYGIGAVAFCCFEVHADLLPNQAWLLLLYPALVALAYILLKRDRKREVETRYLDYRALAEAYRVQFYWNLAGVDKTAADYYLRTHRSDLEWLRIALRYLRILQKMSRRTSLSDRLDLIVPCWTDHQEGFFRQKVPGIGNTLHRTDAISQILLGTAWTMACTAGVALLVPGTRAWLQQYKWVQGTALLLISVLSVSAGLLHGYNVKLAHKENLRRYRESAFAFRRASEAIQRALARGDAKTAREVVHQLGLEALDENSDWLLRHRDRPAQVPV